jgi:hypothetical protein
MVAGSRIPRCAPLCGGTVFFTVSHSAVCRDRVQTFATLPTVARYWASDVQENVEIVRGYGFEPQSLFRDAKGNFLISLRWVPSGCILNSRKLSRSTFSTRKTIQRPSGE